MVVVATVWYLTDRPTGAASTQGMPSLSVNHKQHREFDP